MEQLSRQFDQDCKHFDQVLGVGGTMTSSPGTCASADARPGCGCWTATEMTPFWSA